MRIIPFTVICLAFVCLLSIHLCTGNLNSSSNSSSLAPSSSSAWSFPQLLTRKWPINGPWTEDLEHEGSGDGNADDPYSSMQSSARIKPIDQTLTWTILTMTKIHLQPTSSQQIYTTPSFYYTPSLFSDASSSPSSWASWPVTSISPQSPASQSLTASFDSSASPSITLSSSVTNNSFAFNSPSKSILGSSSSLSSFRSVDQEPTTPVWSEPRFNVVSSTAGSISDLVRPELSSFVQSSSLLSPSFDSPSTSSNSFVSSSHRDQAHSSTPELPSSDGALTPSLVITTRLSSIQTESQTINSSASNSINQTTVIVTTSTIPLVYTSAWLPTFGPINPITASSDARTPSLLFSLSFPAAPSFERNQTKDESSDHLVTSVILSDNLSDALTNLTESIEKRLQTAFEVAYARQFNLTSNQVIQHNFSVRLWKLQSNQSNDQISLVYEVLRSKRPIDGYLVRQVFGHLTDLEMATLLGIDKVLSKAEPFIGNQPNLPNEAVREKTIIQKAFYTLDAWQLLLIAGVAFVAVSICCCLWLICWWKERKLQRALIRRLAADVSNNSAKVSPASTPRNKKYPDHLPSTGPSAHHSFQGWRGNKRRAGASSPSHEFEYISFTSDASGPPTVGWNSNQNTLQSINSPTSMQSNLDSTREFSRNQESVGKHRKRTQRTSNVRTAGPNRAPDITTNDKFKPVATSTLDWPIRSDPSLKTADERDRLDSVPKERIIPITTEHFAEEAPWSEEEMDMNRSSYERLRVPPAQANVQDKVFFGDIAGDLLKEPRVTFPDGWNKGPIGSSPTVVRHEQVIEEIEEITNSPYTDPALVQDLLQLQMDEQTRSIIHAIRGELKRLTPTPATAAQHKRRV